MPFTFKLARRLALSKASASLLATALLAVACRFDRLTPTTVHPLDHIDLIPAAVTLQAGQSADLAATGISTVGDTNNLPLVWRMTGGGLTDTFTLARVHYGRYQAPRTNGDYLVIVSALAGTPSDTTFVTVRDVAVDSVIVAPDSSTLLQGTKTQFAATPVDSAGTPLAGRTILWTSSDTTIAVVSGAGVVTALAQGSATITATSDTKSGHVPVHVSKIPVASVTVTPSTASLATGGTVQLTATPRDSLGNVLNGRVISWTTSAPSVAQVSGSGKVTAIAPGAATVSATCESQSGSAAITVTAPPVASVVVTPESATIRVGTNVQLTATPKDSTGTPLSGRVVTWSSSATTVATVSASGLVSGLAAGTATITATSEGKSGTAKTTVTIVPVASVTVSPASATVAVGATQQLTATTRDSAGNVLSGRLIGWSGNAPLVATVSGSGLVTAVAPGLATITATSEGKSGSAAITVPAPPPPPPPPPASVGVCVDTLAPPVPPPLRTFYVDGTGGNDASDGLSAATAWRTLAKANATAMPGDLFLLSGSFTGQIIHPVSSGTSVAKIVYRNKPGATALISGGQYGVIVWLDGLSNIVVDGIELTNEAEVALLRYGTNNVWLRNLYIHDAGSTGIHLVQATDNRIEDSRIERSGSEINNAGEGIFIQDGSSRNHIVRNTITYAGHGDLWISYQSASEATSDDNVLERNDFSNPWASGIGVNGKTNRTIVQCNRIHNTADGTGVNYARGGVEIEGNANVVRYNEIFRSGAEGITIQGRTLFGFTQNATNNLIYNNTLWQNGTSGTGESVQLIQMDVGNVQNNTIENNIFWDDRGFTFNGVTYALTVDLYHATTPWPTGSANGNIVRNNIASAGQALLLVIRNAPSDDSYTLAQAQATFAGWSANFQSDPLFVNELTDDVLLQSTSPAIDKGIIISGVPYLGLAPDLGAHELR